MKTFTIALILVAAFAASTNAGIHNIPYDALVKAFENLEKSLPETKPESEALIGDVRAVEKGRDNEDKPEMVAAYEKSIPDIEKGELKVQKYPKLIALAKYAIEQIESLIKKYKKGNGTYTESDLLAALFAARLWWATP